jgi:hypothetical protein
MRFRNVLRHGVGLVMILAAPFSYGQQEGREPTIEPQVKEALQKMVNYFQAADTISFRALNVTEDVSSTLQKLQYDTSVEGVIQRPNKVYFKKSGHEQATLWFDGQTATILDRKANRYAKMAINGDLSDLISKLDALGIETPFAGLFDKNIVKHVENHVFKGDYYGAVSCDGLETAHLAFRQDAVDWQLWTDVLTGAPKKVVITSKMLAAAPEHMLLFKEVKVNPADVSSATFQPAIPQDAEEIPMKSEALESLRNVNW